MNINNDKISIQEAGLIHVDVVKEWFRSSHVQEFFGTDDYTLNNFTNNILNGKKDLFDYWIVSYNGEPFSLIMTSDASEDTPEHLMNHIEPDGLTLTVDFLIGNKKFLGKGLSYATLKAFQNFLGNRVTALLIDPECKNSKAVHVYEKAGFKTVSAFTPNEGAFSGLLHFLMKWKRS